MIIFLNDDPGCRHWLTHHRTGFAVEGMRSRTTRRLIVHAATCSVLREAARRGRATTRGRWTACAVRREEVVAWAEVEYGQAPAPCDVCRGAAASDTAAAKPAFGRLARDILDYVLDVAVIHLESDERPYHLRVGDVAQCLRKTPGQLAAPLRRLTQEGLLTLERTTQRGPQAELRTAIGPTAAALRTLPYFHDRDATEVAAAIARLHPQPSEEPAG